MLIGWSCIHWPIPVCFSTSRCHPTFLEIFFKMWSCIPSYHISLIPSLSRSIGSTCPAPTVPSSPPSMQSRPAKTYSGWCSPLSSPPCLTLTHVPIRTAITCPTVLGCWGTTRWLGPGSSAPLGTQGAGAREMNRWGKCDDNVRVTERLFFFIKLDFASEGLLQSNFNVCSFWKKSKKP